MELFDQAARFHLDGKYKEAEELYDKILTQNHKHPHLLATMGSLYLQMGKTGLAIALLEASLNYDKTLQQSDILSNLGMAYYRSGQVEKAQEYLERAVNMGDPAATTLAAYSALFVESGEPEKFVEAATKAIEKDPSLPIAHWNLALGLLAQGQWERAWDEYEWGLQSRGMRIDRKLKGVPYWDGTPGKVVAIYGEQGIGDEIMFASCLPDIMKTNTVILDCHKRLKTLFEKSFPGLKVYGDRENRNPEWVEKEHFDYQCSIGSLGKHYRRSRESFPGTPYLKAESLLPDGKFRVGVSWTGGLKEGRVRKRSVPLSWWKPILNVVDCEFVSLQYTDCDEELDLVGALGYDIKRFPEVHMDDYYETAKLVQSCDLVISVCTSVVHLAGALGVPCWCMTPKNPAWRYQDSGGMPWYRSVRLYRQPDTTQDSWFPVIKKIGFDLSDIQK